MIIVTAAVKILQVLVLTMLTNYCDNIRNDFKIINNKNHEVCNGTDIENIGYIRKIKYKNSSKTLQECWESKSRKFNVSIKDFLSLSRDISGRNMNIIKIGQLNINSIRNNFALLVLAVVGNLHILLLTERLIALFQELNLKLMVPLLPTELIEIVMEVYYYT